MNYHTDELAYVVFKNGKSIVFDNLEKALNIDDGLFYTQRKISENIFLPTYGNRHIRSEYELYDINKNNLQPLIDGFKLVKVESFLNTARYQKVISNIKFSIVSKAFDLIHLVCLGENSLEKPIQILFDTINLVNQAGDYDSYKKVMDSKLYKEVDGELFYDVYSRFRYVKL